MKITRELKRDNRTTTLTSTAREVITSRHYHSFPSTAAEPRVALQVTAATGCGEVWVIAHVVTVVEVGMVKLVTGSHKF